MLEGFIERLILYYFGDYIENLDTNKLSLGLWSGSLALEDIKIRSKAINALKLPFKFIFGKIGKLTINIPWKQNFSVPTVLNIDTIQILLQITKKEQWDFINYNSFENKIYYLQKFANERLYQLSQAFNTQNSGSSYFDRVFVKVLDNLHINFKNIDIRIEDSTNHYSLGVKLEEMFVVNTNDKWEQEFIDRNVEKNIDLFKLLKITNFGIYLNINENYFISESEEARISEKMINYYNEGKVSYLIQPISLTAKMKENNTSEKEPKRQLFINLDKFDFLIEKKQFDCLIRIANDVSLYQKVQYDYNNTIKYKYFAPKVEIKGNYMKWWKHAIKMVIKQIKYSKGNFDVFKIPAERVKLSEENFGKLYKKYFKDKASLTEEENEQFKEILELTELKDLYIWSKPVLQDIYTEQKKEEKKNSQTGYFFSRTINDKDLITKEEEEKIEEILANAVKEATSLIINNEIETKLQLNFTLNDGSFKFSKLVNAKNAIITEGFGLRYSKLFFSCKKGEYFIDISSELKEFQIEMFTIINENETKIPITFKKFSEDLKLSNPVLNIKTKGDDIEIVADSNSVSSSKSLGTVNVGEEDYFIKVYFRKNNPNDEINTRFMLDVNVLHIVYHQVFLERLITFFTITNLDENLANTAWEKINHIKANTTQTLKENFAKKNIIEMKIEPRMLIIPINKYDIKNTKILCIGLGRGTMLNEEETTMDEKYQEHYSLQITSVSATYYPSFKHMLKNESSFTLINDVSSKLTFAMLGDSYSKEKDAGFMLFFDIDKVCLNLNPYLYTLMIYILDILKPTKEVDIWSQLNTSKEEIKKNAKAVSKVMKRKGLSYEELFAVLSSGYIYFYRTSEDDDYVGYYYLKDSTVEIVNSELLIMKLSSVYGTIELKFSHKNKFDQWNKCINDRISEMKMSLYDKEEDIDNELKQSKVNPKTIYFGGRVNFFDISCVLYNNNNEKIYDLVVSDMTLNIALREHDSEMSLGIGKLKLYDEHPAHEDFRLMISSEFASQSNNSSASKPQGSEISDKIFLLKLLICDENSDKYQNIQILTSIHIGYINMIWDPIAMRRFLGFTVHNNIIKYKIKREIYNQSETLVNSNFLDPGTEEVVSKLQCNIDTYTYIQMHCEFKEVAIIFVHPIKKIMYNEMKLGKTFINCDMKVDHFELDGELGNTQLFDMAQYPFMIKSQDEFDPTKIKEIFGIKKNTESLISFKYKSYSSWCPCVQDNYTSEADVKINSTVLVYVHEHFMRFFNYFIGEFLGSMGPSEEVIKFQNEQYKIKPKNSVDIDFMKLNLQIENPQIILKPRYHMKEFFKLDLGNIKLKCEYQKVYGKVRARPEEYRWSTTYQFDMKNITIVTEDDFNILSPCSSVINMHFSDYSNEDQLLSEKEYDFSYQFDIFFDEMIMQLRQKDYTNLMRVIDLNIFYTDGDVEANEVSRKNTNDSNLSNSKISKKSSSASFESFEDITSSDGSIPKKPNASNVNATKSLKENKEELYKKYFSLISYAMFSKIRLLLFINENPFSELVLNGTQMIFTQNLAFFKEMNFIIDSIEMYDSLKQNILSDFSASILSNTKTHIIKQRESSTSIRTLGTLISNIKDKILQCQIMPNDSFKTCRSQMSIQITIDAEREKNYQVQIDGFKILVHLDTFELMRFFFLEGFPFYSKHSKDLPNAYDPNEENNPGMKLFVEVKHGIICFLTDELTNKEQELICITSDITFGIKSLKVSKVKKILLERYKELKDLANNYIEDKARKESLNNEIANDKCVSWEMRLNLFDICPFFTNYNEVNSGKDIIIGKRKIMDDFKLTYESQVIIQYMGQVECFIIKYLQNITLTKITLKGSYRDLVLFGKMYKFSLNMFNQDFTTKKDSLMNYSKMKALEEEIDKKTESVWKKSEIKKEELGLKLPKNSDVINKGMGLLTFISEGFKIILIDDHANTFYPFLSFILLDFKYTNESLSLRQSFAKLDFLFTALTYNYRAGGWESLVEQTKISAESTTDNTGPNLVQTTYTIKTAPVKSTHDVNITISDLSIVFLCTTLSKWIDGYNSILASKEINDEKNMTISNHSLVNYTGRSLTVFTVANDKRISKPIEIFPNSKYELPYFEGRTSEANKENKKLISELQIQKEICLKFPDIEGSKKLLKIDNILQKLHDIDYFEKVIRKEDIKEYNQFKKYAYIISKVECRKMKKFVYFYSPLCFKNKTKFTFTIELRAPGQRDIQLSLSPKGIIGIPFEYLIGYINIKDNSFPLSSFLEGKNRVLKEFKSDDNIFFNLYHPPTKGNKIPKYKIIKIRTSYTIRNCLPFDITITTVYDKVFNIQKNETAFLYELSIYSPLKASISFDSFKTLEPYILCDNEDVRKVITINVYDDLKKSLPILVSLISDNEIIIHCSTVIINHTGLNLFFNYGKEEKEVNKPVSNQKNRNNFFLMGEEKYLMICFNGYKSKAITLNTLGTSSVIEIINKQAKQKIEVVMETALSLIAIDLDIYTAIITFLPRFILYNTIKNFLFDVIIENGSIDNKPIKLDEGEKRPLYYTGISTKESPNYEIKFLPKDKNNENIKWKLSTPYSTTFSSNVTTLYVKAKNVNNQIPEAKCKMYFNIEKQVDNLITYLILKPCNKSNAQILVKNYSSKISFSLYQEGFEHFKEYCNVKSKLIFAWGSILQKPLIILDFFVGDIRKNPFKYQNTTKKYEICEDKVIEHGKDLQNVQNYPFYSKIVIKESVYMGCAFKLSILWEGNNTVISISDIIEDISEYSTKLVTKNEYNMYINRLGLSIVSDNSYKKSQKYERKELAYFTFEGIRLFTRREIHEGIVSTDFQIVVNDLEIDNEISYLNYFPIIFLPQESPRKFIEKNPLSKKEDRSKKKEDSSKKTEDPPRRNFRPFLELALFMNKKSSEDFTRISLFNYLIQAFEFNLESTALVGILEFLNNITIGMQTSFTEINPIFYDKARQKEIGIIIEDWKYPPSWSEKEISSENKISLFISQLEASPLEIILNFESQIKSQLFQKLLQENQLIVSLLNVVSNVEKVPLLLTGCRMFNFQGNWANLISNIGETYKQKMLVQIMKLIGSIDLLGNPLNLLNNLGKGFQDLFEKPAEGLMKGPLQGMVGLVEGGWSLVNHTFDGTFNSTSKITGGISKSMLLLTQDENYIDEREKRKITERPKNIVEGIAYGLSSMWEGVVSGISDIVSKPVQGAKEENAKGFGKGVLKGLGGAVIKPISGVLDLVSKTAEGVKNTFNAENQLTPLRLPRAFYGKMKIVKAYFERDARVIMLMKTKIDLFKDQDIDYFSSEIYKTNKDVSILLVFLVDGFWLIDVVRREAKSFLEYSQIKDVVLEENKENIKLYFQNKINNKSYTNIRLSKNNSDVKRLYEGIINAINSNIEERSIRSFGKKNQ